ncbi:MAG TPA: molecular chaperone HtpG [Candidatus Sphingobacterium stercoripullorum]|uniref:Chaperone protein HtpG n=1 Tax=Candidatus Sphingobacterium stercoripullorum TaxID=2838759 RepID=A0A9D2AY41_9SPHI|nr:molecular chaperone HtpG [Candidatus Sphingobacterium stercoripullorum]HLR50288.1 molecular chaperone HtpG [Candidatus Sphingobacterium stercoripullorum]
MQEKGSISIHTENIFPVIKKFLYSDNEIFLRELVSNAVDATQKINRLSSLGRFSGELGDITIDVKLDKEKKTITISDCGIGMTADEIKKYINQVAFSGATEFVEKFKEAKDANEIIGKFGLGFYSAFMVADLVEIQSLSYQDGAQAVKWSCDGSTSYEISEGNKTQRGTDIILHINEESEEFLEQSRIQNILNKYAKFLPVPIRFGTETKTVEDGKDEKGEPVYKTEEVDNIVNNTTPLWIKTPSELKDEDYLAFYRELYPTTFEEPLFWIHLNVDYPFNLTGVLYFPKVKNDVEVQKNKIKLFSRQVFITDEVNDIVPEFLMLLHGVIDSPDIPLNVSRSFLQSDANVRKINSYITRKVAEKLQELYKADRKAFQEKWDDIGLFVKYGMLSDSKFAEKANEFCLLKNVEQEYFTFKEFYEKVKDIQVNKDGQIVYLYSHDTDQQDVSIQQAKDKGYDVLILDGPLDSHFTSYLEQNGGEKVQLKRIDADVIDKLIEKDQEIELKLSEEQKESLKNIFSTAINNENMSVEVVALNGEDMPVSVTMDEFMRRMKDMAKLGGGMSFYGEMPDNYKVTVNGNHPIAEKIVSAQGEEAEKLAKQAYDLALLSRGLLKGGDLTSFIKRSVELI